MIQIRIAGKDDAEQIVGFQMAMAKETEQLELPEETVHQGVLAVLRDSTKGKYFVAHTGEILVASLLITMEWSDWRNKWMLWIQSVYVLPPFREKGVYRQLYVHIKAWAQQDDEVAGLRLYVDKSNEKAMQVYKKLGMNGEHYRVFEWMK